MAALRILVHAVCYRRKEIKMILLTGWRAQKSKKRRSTVRPIKICTRDANFASELQKAESAVGAPHSKLTSSSQLLHIKNYALSECQDLKSAPHGPFFWSILGAAV